MEVDAKEWLEEVDSKAAENALQIALLQQEVRTNHEAVMRNSDVRLEAIMERFDRLDEGSWRMWSKLAGMFCIIAAATWFAIVEPIHDRLDVIDRRLLDAERYRPAVVTESL